MDQNWPPSLLVIFYLSSQRSIPGLAAHKLPLSATIANI